MRYLDKNVPTHTLEKWYNIIVFVWKHKNCQLLEKHFTKIPRIIEIAFTRNNNFCFDPKAGKGLHNVTSRLASRFSSSLTLHSYQGFSSRPGRPILCLTPDGSIGTTSTDSTVAAVNSTELIDEHLVRDGITFSQP